MYVYTHMGMWVWLCVLPSVQVYVYMRICAHIRVPVCVVV